MRTEDFTPVFDEDRKPQPAATPAPGERFQVTKRCADGMVINVTLNNLSELALHLASMVEHTPDIKIIAIVAV